MFFSIPLIAWLFGLSLQSEQGFQEALDCMQSLPVLVISLVLVWSLGHHLLAGIRHLFLDIEIGVARGAARATAWFVNLGALALTTLYLVWLI